MLARGGLRSRLWPPAALARLPRASFASAPPRPRRGARVDTDEPFAPGARPRWVEARRVAYTREDGERAGWEYATRAARPPPGAPHAAFAVAETTARQLVLVKQFRPPLGRVCVEFPAGLVDAGETPAAAAARELREETGYVAAAAPAAAAAAAAADPAVVFNDPGFTDTSSALVGLTVDLADPRNRSPAPAREPGEFMQVFLVDTARLLPELRALQADGLAVDARLWAYALGRAAAAAH